MYEFYEKIPEADKTHEDKKYFNGGIAMTVILSIAIIAVIAGFIATEARKGGGKLDRKQLEEYGKSLIVKGAAVRTADMIKEKGDQYLNEARDTIAARVINGDSVTSVNSWIAKNNEQKKAAIATAIKEYEKEKGQGQGQQAQTAQAPPSDRPARFGLDAVAPAAAPAVAPAAAPAVEPASASGAPDADDAAYLQELDPNAASPISLSRSYKRRKSPSSLKKKKASPTKKKKPSPSSLKKKKKSTSSRRK